MPAHGARDSDGEGQARAAVYALLAGLLLRPETAPLGWVAAQLPAAPASRDDPLASTWTELVAASRAGAGALRQAHAALFVAAGTPAIDPYASRYVDGALMNTSLAVLRSDLRVLGLERSPGARESEDHLGALCEAMQQLAARGAPTAAQARFLRTHVLPWAPRCLDDITSHPRAGVYSAVAAFASAFLASEDEALAGDGMEGFDA